MFTYDVIETNTNYNLVYVIRFSNISDLDNFDTIKDIRDFAEAKNVELLIHDEVFKLLSSILF